MFAALRPLILLLGAAWTLALAGAAQHEPLAAAPASGPRSFQTTAIVRYAAAPERLHQLVLTCALPDRVRWQLEVGEEPAKERQIRFRSGESVYALEPRATGSVELAGEDRLRVLAQIELRRALTIWPDGFVWKGSGIERDGDLGVLGTLRARFAQAGDPRPIEIGDFDPQGRPHDAYRKIVWREIEGRPWPVSAELWHAGVLVWTETLESASTRARFLDSFFVPPDRVTATAQESAHIQVVEVPAVCGRRIELARARSDPEQGREPRRAAAWEKAIAEIEVLHADWALRLRERGHELEARATVEVDDRSQPRACILRLTRVPGTAPEGFTTTPACKAAALALRGLDQLNPEHLKLLSASAPPGADHRSPYVRFDLAQPTVGQALLLLPFASASK